MLMYDAYNQILLINLWLLWVSEFDYAGLPKKKKKKKKRLLLGTSDQIFVYLF